MSQIRLALECLHCRIQGPCIVSDHHIVWGDSRIQGAVLTYIVHVWLSRVYPNFSYATHIVYARELEITKILDTYIFVPAGHAGAPIRNILGVAKGQGTILYLL